MEDLTQVLDELRQSAIHFRPRLFSLFGVYRPIAGIRGPRPYLGWGLDLGHENQALLWNPDANTTHESGSAEQLLAIHRRTGTASLLWFDHHPAAQDGMRSAPA